MPYENQHTSLKPDFAERERHIRQAANVMGYDPKNPFTYSANVRNALGAGFIGVVGWQLTNGFYRRPFFAGGGVAVPYIAAFMGAAYLIGNVQQTHNMYKQAIIAHYKAIHPKDFEHLDPANARRLRDVLQPWYPIRMQQMAPLNPETNEIQK